MVLASPLKSDQRKLFNRWLLTDTVKEVNMDWLFALGIFFIIIAIIFIILGFIGRIAWTIGKWIIIIAIILAIISLITGKSVI
jgi:hypothetical protein